MKKAATLLLLTLIIPLTSAEAFNTENGIEAEVKELQGDFNIEETDTQLDRPTYQSFKIEGNNFKSAEISFSIPPSWLDSRGYEPYQTAIINSDTKIWRVSGNFQDYKANISEPGEYFITGYTQTVKAENPETGECGEYLETPEDFKETEECTTTTLGPTPNTNTTYVILGLLATLILLFTVYRTSIYLIDRKITAVTEELTSTNKDVDQEALEMAMAANKKASEGHHFKALKILVNMRR